MTLNSNVGMLHHVEIYVADLSKTSEFWSWFLGELGYELSQKWEGGESWSLGQTYLVFVQVAEKHLSPTYNRCKVGLNHLAFHAASREHVEKMKDEIERRGMKLLYPDRHPFAGGDNYYALFFEDPDRIKVELVAPS